jgi:hypothetical protein
VDQRLEDLATDQIRALLLPRLLATLNRIDQRITKLRKRGDTPAAIEATAFDLAFKECVKWPSLACASFEKTCRSLGYRLLDHDGDAIWSFLHSVIMQEETFVQIQISGKVGMPVSAQQRNRWTDLEYAMRTNLEATLTLRLEQAAAGLGGSRGRDLAVEDRLPPKRQPAAKSRHPRPAKPNPRPRDRRLRILFLASNPLTTAALDLEGEKRDLERALDGVRYGREIAFRSASALTRDDLIRRLRKDRPTIVHFSGHNSRKGIFLRRDDGSHVQVPNKALKQVLKDRGVTLVVLNACASRTQAALLSSVVPSIVGTTAAVDDEAARRFAVAFYRTIGEGETVATAFRDGQDSVVVHGFRNVFIAYGDLSGCLCGPRAR